MGWKGACVLAVKRESFTCLNEAKYMYMTEFNKFHWPLIDCFHTLSLRFLGRIYTSFISPQSYSIKLQSASKSQFEKIWVIAWFCSLPHKIVNLVDDYNNLQLAHESFSYLKNIYPITTPLPTFLSWFEPQSFLSPFRAESP